MIMTLSARLSTTSRTNGECTGRRARRWSRLDTDGKNADPDRSVYGLERVGITARHSTFLAQIACEICGVDVGLKTDQVVLAHRRNEMFMIRQRRENFRRRKRDVMEKADPVAVAGLAQRFGQR
jgi:hypothetical protein